MKRCIAMVGIVLVLLGMAACAAQESAEPGPNSSGVLAATFEGMMDGHTIEVIARGKTVTMQLEGDAQMQAEGYEKGDAVIIHYVRREGVMYAQAIEMAPAAQ